MCAKEQWSICQACVLFLCLCYGDNVTTCLRTRNGVSIPFRIVLSFCICDSVSECNTCTDNDNKIKRSEQKPKRRVKKRVCVSPPPSSWWWASELCVSMAFAQLRHCYWILVCSSIDYIRATNSAKRSQSVHWIVFFLVWWDICYEFQMSVSYSRSVARSFTLANAIVLCQATRNYISFSALECAHAICILGNEEKYRTQWAKSWWRRGDTECSFQMHIWMPWQMALPRMHASTFKSMLVF